MKTVLTEKMIKSIKNAVGIEGLSFKYSEALDVFAQFCDEQIAHRVMCKGEKTRNKWIWLGDAEGPFNFESPEQAKLYVTEIKAEVARRLSESE
ncbi:hypothetical protein [Vibrio cholerae]|uniref:hypothetical protein n=1 Tax=Vibrio cholerae TaxID=666 RepID=UPI00084AFE3F|nr:hypothetical protein [Vibrio cholerae]OEC22186.1 hypothetical protein BFX10_10670 [Vibrio cholerae]